MSLEIELDATALTAQFDEFERITGVLRGRLGPDAGMEIIGPIFGDPRSLYEIDVCGERLVARPSKRLIDAIDRLWAMEQDLGEDTQ